MFVGGGDDVSKNVLKMGANDKKDLLRLPRVFGETRARLPVVELRL